MIKRDADQDRAVRSFKSDDYVTMVLLVDDQLIIAEAVRRMLAGESDIDFHFCSEAAEAIGTAQRIAPTVILQDLVMPGIEGLALVRAYRSSPVTRNIPVVVLSSREDPTTKSEAFAAGANDYLVKLPDRIELIARIRYHSRAYLNQMQRDEAHRALRESQSQLMDANLELQRLMNLDGLTGLNNRRRFDEYANSEWRRALRERQPISVLLADVDDFKQYNDTYGHLAGDSALKGVANAIRASCVRPADLCARFGGEEFAIILPGTDAAGAQHVGESMRAAVEKLLITHDGSTSGPHVTISLGGASVTPGKSDSLMDAIARADAALYQAKRDGKNRVLLSEWARGLAVAASN